MTLPGFQIIEIVLALLTLYIFLCILITAFNEFLDCLLDRRRKYFKKAIDNLLGYGNIDNNENPFFSNDIIKSINKSTGNKYTNIPDGIIADVILNIWYKSNQENRSNTDNLNQIIDIQMVNADKELVKIKKNLKNWLIEFWDVESQINSLPNFQIKSLFQAHCFYYSLVLIKKSPTIFAGQDTFN